MTDGAKKRGRPAKSQNVACEVLRDFWDEDGNRTRKGAIVEMPAVEAIDLIEAGQIRKVK
jgi:hypothetical protein